ncbi:hypothetical protein [Nitrospira sp. KM1]|uniref:hypothetical protein n=1 Tax=Nitrospira sp. KM1 TaxID=1936990 RepID=UPI00156344E4|nr:hypothetical protein [Nitrospira sp. KM1]
MPEHEAMKPDQPLDLGSAQTFEHEDVTTDSTTVWSMPSVSSPSTLYREVPSINGEYSVGGQTFLPYLGAGFNSGYSSQLDRSLNSGLSPTAVPGVGNNLGQSLSPNEFQMGVRIPF